MPLPLLASCFSLSSLLSVNWPMDTSTRGSGSRPSTLEYKRSMSINYAAQQSLDISQSQAIVAEASSADEIAGMLLKRRGGFGKHMPNAWQLRYFTIRDGVLMYFEGDNCSQPRGRMDLKALNCTFQLGLVFENAPTPFTMQIAPGGGEEKWKLCAENPEDLERWSMCIEKHVNDKNRREAVAHVVSDDEYFPEDGETEPRKRAGSGPRVAQPRGTSVAKIFSTDTGSTGRSNVPTSRPGLSTNTSTKETDVKGSSNRPKSSRRRLKLRAESSTPPETVEMIMALFIFNTCVVMVKYSDNLVFGLLYLIVANIVIARTLYLRGKRLESVGVPAVPDASESETKNLETNNGMFKYLQMFLVLIKPNVSQICL